VVNIKGSGIYWSMEAQEKLQKERDKIEKFEESYRKNPEFKSYDIDFAGRKSELLYNIKTGEIVVDGMLFKPEMRKADGFIIVSVGDHEYRISQATGQLFLDGRLVEFSYSPSVPKLIRKSGTGGNTEVIRSPLPGLITELYVNVGDKVNPGSKILTLEAMKMQNEIITESGGIVEKILIKLGSQTETHQDLVVISKK
jgi:acetyl/propionyl-CoA carboxylase alpha subunit